MPKSATFFGDGAWCFSNSPALEVLKQSNAAGGTGSGWATGAGDKAISSNFTASSSYLLTKCILKLGRFNSSVTGQIRCSIYARSGTQTAGLPTGSPLAVSTGTIDGTTLSTAYPSGQTLCTFLFAPSLSLVNGTGYCHVLTAESMTGLAFSIWMSNAANVGTIGKSTVPVTTWSALIAATDWLAHYENWGT